MPVSDPVRPGRARSSQPSDPFPSLLGLPDLTRLVVAQAPTEPVEGDTEETRRQEVFQNFRDYTRLGLYADLDEVEPVA